MRMLVFTHVLFTTVGYVGLIAVSAYALMLVQSDNTSIVRYGIAAWRKAARVFGPLLAVGVAIGIGLATASGVSLTSSWLIATYVLIAVAIAAQAAIMIPWQLRTNVLLEAGRLPPRSPLVVVLVALSLIYTAIVWLMVTRP